MGKSIDITGIIYNQLTAIKYIETDKFGHEKWLFLCSCGKEKLLNKIKVKTGATKSCGCRAFQSDITGEKYNMLTAVRTSYKKNPKSSYYWWFKCDCGNEKEILKSYVIKGTVKSCGCLAKRKSAQRAKKTFTTHSQTKTETYVVWQNMKSRCSNPKSISYENYGSRGISVCDRWQEFENFIEDMGLRPPNRSLDRIDNDKGYFKENCRWVTVQQQSNNKRNNFLIEWCGKKLNCREWEKETGITASVIRERIKKYNWTIEKSLTTKIKERQ